MNAAHPYHGQLGAVPLGGTGSLREAMNRRASLGHRLGLEAAVAQLVPLCLELAEVHAQGYGFYLHPSSITETADGSLILARERATDFPSDPRDRACLPPETVPGQLNDARGNVYALGAIFYEMLTGASVGPGMRRALELVPGLPTVLDDVLAAALLPDPQHRPSNLTELAQSIRQLAAARSAPPASRLLGLNAMPNGQLRAAPSLNPAISVDVSLSLVPPLPASSSAAVPGILNGSNPSAAGAPPASSVLPVAAPGSSPPSVNGYGVAVQAAPERSAAAQAAHIAELRAQLESDSLPRYFVVKNGMDHGPFNAVELVRQIDAHAFTEEDEALDSVDGRRAPIGEWPQFAVFAQHAKRERQLAQRQKDIVQVAAAEKKSTRGKALAGLLILVALLGAGGVWYSAASGERQDTVAIQEDESTNVETDGSLSVKGKKKSRRRAGSRGSIPALGGGQSCEAAMDAYNEMKSMGENGPADITAGQYGRVLNSGSYFSHCGVPFSMSVNICAAVQNGRAVGVTVTTQPNDAKKAACVASAVRGLSFPSHPKLDVTRTRFAAQ